MSDFIDGKALRKLVLGKKVERATSAMTNALELFTVGTGRCLVTLMLGQVTTDIQNTSVDFTIVADPTTGTSTNIAALLAVDDDEAGTMYSVAGAAATALVEGSSGSVAGPLQPFIVAPGAIEITMTGAHTGSVKWTLFYIPIDDGATIVAA